MMGKQVWVEDTLTLSGQEVPVRAGAVAQTSLLFYPDNPRLYSMVRANQGNPSQEEIEQRLSVMDHVKQLIQSIEANGGLTDPLVVRDGDFVVLEGNSRLAAYRALARHDPILWGKVKVKLLPADIDEDMVFALLGEYHIIGKKDWAPYEQAGYLYRRHKSHGVDPARMAEEMGLATRTVNHLIAVYEFMVAHGETDVGRWSYYEEYLKSNASKKARKACPQLDQIVVTKVRSREIAKAVDVREKLMPVIKAGGKAFQRFVSGEDTLEEAYEDAITQGATNPWYNRFHRFRMQLAAEETWCELLSMPKEQRNKCAFELKKMAQAIEANLKRIKP